MSRILIQSARKRPTVAAGVREYLRRQIIEGSLLPGEALSENELAALLGVSRTPVREAIIKLEEEGLVIVYPQYGTFVAPIRVSDVYDGQFVRESLECAALVKAVEIIGPRDTPSLQAALSIQKRSRTGDPAPFFEADEVFHSLFMKIAGHERAWHVVEAAKAQHDRVRRLNVHNPLKRQSVLHEHAAILDCVLRRDAPGAVETMKQHLRGVFKSVEAVMEQHPEYFETVDRPMPLPARPAGARDKVLPAESLVRAGTSTQKRKLDD
jgi:DNA-binding GntR family transcriptional regulator